MAAHLTRLETRTKEFNIRASCWDLKPASTVKARHSVRCVLARSRHLGRKLWAGRTAGPSNAHVALAEFERAR
jgi:hypothetical protein